MSAELLELSGNVLMLIVSGKLSYVELKDFQTQASALFKKHDKVRILVLAEDFQGWEREGDWGDMSFQEEHDDKVERMAIVGDSKWKELVLAFVGQGFREFPIEYFEHGQVSKARAWLHAR